jgi:iron complex transport system substrate-binding protein
VAPCGFGIERTLREMNLLVERPGWRDLRAVRSGRVAVADGNRYFNRSGPSVVQSIEILAEILHPEEFPALKQGTRWRYY